MYSKNGPVCRSQINAAFGPGAPNFRAGLHALPWKWKSSRPVAIFGHRF